MCRPAWIKLRAKTIEVGRVPINSSFTIVNFQIFTRPEVILIKGIYWIVKYILEVVLVVDVLILLVSTLTLVVLLVMGMINLLVG